MRGINERGKGVEGVAAEEVEEGVEGMAAVQMNATKMCVHMR